MCFWTNALQKLKNIIQYKSLSAGWHNNLCVCVRCHRRWVYLYNIYIIIIWINCCHFRWQYPVRPSDSLINISWKRVVVFVVAAMVNNNKPLATETVATVVGPDRRLPEKRALKVCIRTSAPAVLLSDRVISRHYNI